MLSITVTHRIVKVSVYTIHYRNIKTIVPHMRFLSVMMHLDLLLVRKKRDIAALSESNRYI